MKHFNKRLIYIVLFAILYVCVGLVSTIHAVSFFALANGMTLAVILACAFEIGQAAVLFSILTDIRKRKKVMPWLLMSVLTIVQILGNIYASYKYLITNSIEKLKYFKEPIFVWMSMPDQNANVILCYIIGAILPIVSLLMTAMLTSYLGNDAEEALENNENEEYEEENKEKTIAEEIEEKNVNKIHIGNKTFKLEEDEEKEHPEEAEEKEHDEEENFIPALEDTPGKEIDIEEPEEEVVESHVINN